ncbi:MAG: transcriptional regulator [Rhodocyclaceae bacterium]|nr:transcriptional regulator [Rhodocyclaceae bacterium]
MYAPAQFKEERPQVLQDLVARYPLATLVTLGPEGLEANPIPLLYDPTPQPGAPHGVLRGHLARANPQWQRYRPEVDALVIFQGPQAYISPNWYPSKAEHGKAVPTWNYAVVQAAGSLRVIEDPTWLRRLLADLTAAHESRHIHPWTLDDAPEEFIAAQLKGIVGIELAIRTLTGKWKMSQNRPAADRQGVQTALAASDESQKAVAELVAQTGTTPVR